MDEQKLIEIRNEIFSIEKHLIVLNRFTFDKCIWEVAHHSGDLQRMITMLDESLSRIKLASDTP